MPTEYTIQQLLNIGDLSSVLASVDNGKNIFFKGAVLDPMLPRTIVRVKRSLALRYSANPSDTTLRKVGEYLLQLCGPYALQAENILNNLTGSLPVITGPANQSVLVGGNAVFSVSVASSTSISYQWYANGVLIPGAISSSYTVTNAQLTQSGNTYFVVATNAAGSLTSNTATLTVTASLVASYYFGTTDYSSQLLANSDVVPYVGTFSITSGQPLSFTWPSGAANNQFIVIRYPATESVKTTYSNAPLNNGLIPSIAFNAVVTFGGFNYIFSRSGNPFSQNTAAPLIFS